MKVLIIGGGAISEMFHIPASLELLGAEKLFLAEPDEARRKQMTEKFGLINHTADYREFLSEVDFAIVATPPHVHLQIMRACMEAKVHVLCEKPLALNAAECRQLLDLQQIHGVQAALCHTYRFFPNRREMRERILNDFFGADLHIQIEEGEPASWESVSGYNFRKELVPGGVFLDAGIHSLDFILWCLGKPLEINYEDDSLGGLESNLRLRLAFENGKTAAFRLSRTCTLSNKITVQGKSQQLEMDIFEMMKYRLNDQESETESAETCDWTNIASIQPRDFMSAIESGKEPMCSLAEGAAVIDLIEQCYTLKKQRSLPQKAPLPGWTF